MTRLSVSWFNPLKGKLAVTKVADLWSWFLEKIRSPKTSHPAMRHAPTVPTHKSPVNRGFQVVVMNERRRSVQYDLSPGKFRIGIIGGLVIAGLSVLGAYSIGKVVWGHFYTETEAYDGAKAVVSSQYSDKVEGMVNGAFRPKGYSNAASFGASSRQSSSDQQVHSEDMARSEKSAMSMQSAEKLEGDLSSGLQSPSVNSGIPIPQRGAASNETDSAGAVAQLHRSAASEASQLPIVNFNAQDVTVKPSGNGKGTLSFRLIRDHPELAFSGYLFVFVEMQDKKGENRIYVYPDKTRLGEGDLPSDFREGESLTFKNNSRVELPYGDVRQGAGLARVSILLYSDQGKIVFQRGFEKKELLVSGATGSQQVEGAKPKPADTRRAL